MEEKVIKSIERLEKNMIMGFESLRIEIDEKLEKQKEELTKNLVTKDELNRRFDEQNKEIAQEFRNIVKYFEDKQKKQEKINQQFYEEFEKNRVSHDGYNSKIYKIELTQSTLERKVLDLEENKKIPV